MYALISIRPCLRRTSGRRRKAGRRRTVGLLLVSATLAATGVPINASAAEKAAANKGFAAESLPARIRHQLPAADADALALRGRAPSGRFDIRSSMPAPASGPRGHAGRRLDALATKVDDGCGLTPESAASIARRETGGRVLSVMPLNGAEQGYRIRLLLDGGRVATILVDARGSVRRQR